MAIAASYVVEITNREDKPVTKFISRMAHSCSDFGHYFIGIQNANCADCPDCRCEDGPSLEEAQKDYREMLRIRYSTARFFF